MEKKDLFQNPVVMVFLSLWHWPRLWLSHQFIQQDQHYGRKVSFGKYGIYRIFRETSCRSLGKTDQSVILLVNFKLWPLSKISLFHQLFEKLCILSLPIWSGTAGFQHKYWLVNDSNHHYLGLYQWQSKRHAENYARMLLVLLKPFAEHSTVWYKMKLT